MLNDILIEKDVISGLRGLQLQRDHARNFLSVIAMTLIAMHKSTKVVECRETRGTYSNFEQ